ncbi:MAG: TatD family hydrolase [Candidatus Bipolaricaulota bacterium]
MLKDNTLIDSHAHLNLRQYEDDREKVIQRAKGRGVSFFNMGTGLTTSKESAALAEQYDHVYAAVGFHPHQADHFTKDSPQILADLAEQEKVLAIGEIGLDYYRNNSPHEDQREAFRAQLELARNLDLPVSIHNRSSTPDLLEILRDLNSRPNGVIHSFFGDRELAEAFLDLGFLLGLSGPITYGDNRDLQRTLRKLPLSCLLLETDSPYLTPAPHRGDRNEPAYVRHIAHKLADIKNITFDEVVDRTTANTRELFRLNE